MSVRTAVTQRLTTIPALAGMGVHCDGIPEQAQYPAVVFAFEKIKHLYMLDGPTGIVDGQIIFAVLSYNKDDCAAGIQAIKTTFNGFTGPMAAPGGNGVTIRNVMKIVDESDDEYNAPDGSSKVLFEMRQTYSINYKE